MNGRKKILLINFGGIGDEILFLPTIKTIKEGFPGRHVTLIVEPRAGSIIEGTDLIDEVKTFDIKKQPLLLADLLALLAVLRGSGYDMVLSSGSSPLVSCLLWLSGIKHRIGYDSGPLSQLLLTAAVPLKRDQYAAAMYHDLVRGLQIHKESKLPELVVKEQNRKSMRKFLSAHGVTNNVHDENEHPVAQPATRQVRILIHPGTSRLAVDKGILKHWPAGNWARLIASLSVIKDVNVIVAGGPDDESTINDIAQFTAQNRYVSAYGFTRGLGDLIALIDLCDLLVCVDSAPMHIGVGLRKPLVALFGPTEPLDLLPQDPRFKALRGIDVSNPSAGVHLDPEIVLEAVLAQLPV